MQSLSYIEFFNLIQVIIIFWIGIVKDGSFIVAETDETKKFTSVGLVEAVTPESRLMNLTAYDGRVI